MAKSKKKRKSHKGPPKPFRRRWAEIEELLGPENMKEVRGRLPLLRRLQRV